MKIIYEVYPHKGESKDDFISRFMSVTKDEYPDQKQRYAVALSYWDRRNESLTESDSPKGYVVVKHYIYRNVSYVMIAVSSSILDHVSYSHSEAYDSPNFNPKVKVYNSYAEAREVADKFNAISKKKGYPATWEVAKKWW